MGFQTKAIIWLFYIWNKELVKSTDIKGLLFLKIKFYLWSCHNCPYFTTTWEGNTITEPWATLPWVWRTWPTEGALRQTSWLHRVLRDVWVVIVDSTKCVQWKGHVNIYFEYLLITKESGGAHIFRNIYPKKFTHKFQNNLNFIKKTVKKLGQSCAKLRLS